MSNEATPSVQTTATGAAGSGSIASYIDHTLLKPEASEAEILRVCAEAAVGEESPLMVAIGTLHAARLAVKQLVAERRITELAAQLQLTELLDRPGGAGGDIVDAIIAAAFGGRDRT